MGEKYNFEMYVSRPENFIFSISDIGVCFSNDSVSSLVYEGLFEVSPQIINSNGIISNALDWVKISGTYTAEGGEKYITIGNFNDDDNTNVSYTTPPPIGGIFNYSYYYIDGVSLQRPTCDLIIPSVFTPNLDKINDSWEVLNLDKVYPNNQVFIFNRWGDILYTSEKGNYEERP